MEDNRWTTRVSQSVDDPAWDAFLESHPHGHHLQTTRWARVKKLNGWGVIRTVIHDGESIAGGAQIIYRRVSRLGNVAYISMGPVTVSDDPGLVAEVVRAINQVMAEHKLRLVVVQEPTELLAHTPLMRSAHPLGVVGQVAPRATIVIDVSRDPEDIRAEMKARTRYNTKVGARKGIDVRAGTAADLPAYHAMLVDTAERQGFQAFPLEYYETMWRSFDPVAGIRLTFAEYEGEPVAAQLAVAFGNTVVNKMSVWSGRQGSRRPNDALQWDTICWAHDHGFRHYDLEGIRIEVAEALLRGEDPPDNVRDSVTLFKLGYGGRILVRPTPFACVPNPLLSMAFKHLYPRVAELGLFRRMLKRFRVSSAEQGDESRHPAADLT